MSYNRSRRLFLGGSVAASAVGATGFSNLVSAQSASAAATEAISVIYGPKPGVAKLNANENPFGPSPKALEAIAQASAQGGAYYAYPAAMTLLDMIAERHGITRKNISLSAGSSPILSYAAVAASKNGKILGPDLFWDTTSKAPEKQGAPEIVRIANTADLDIDLDAMYAAIDDSIGMVHICNPNNPTGKVLDPDKLREFCIKASKKTLVLVDEAYNELIDEPPKHSMIPLVKAGHNIIVARTFSKIYGLAGMRVGYLIASEENTEWINRYGMGGYTLNQAGLAAAIASYNDNAFLTFSKEKIYEGKSMVMDAVKANGLTALPSSTNFIFVNLGDGNAEYFRQAMAEKDVLIRGIYRTYNNWSRVSMGKIADVKRYVDAMPAALEKMQAMQKG
ncbi:histidinol-phosphate aminotransferase family protein [Alteromonas sp. BL110]|uniref:pyridoxal phosphate-dependent aminotransferase n=1 Tax=Alteromonas sp. BL110 TaxID=1714845 RepID=UPI000E525852|nr:histidinol-phosphate transaminase [Alteromonas sp. BL110]AXT39180.1 histidinol-phosphate aminotransferase family protein [Alteromonas sp. BL110]RKM82337.1 aminotransferase class I/II-fold pyridoxal phosphate-dependent enzyme [Alteromonas sp. BL110]